MADSGGACGRRIHERVAQLAGSMVQRRLSGKTHRIEDRMVGAQNGRDSSDSQTCSALEAQAREAPGKTGSRVRSGITCARRWPFAAGKAGIVT